MMRTLRIPRPAKDGLISNANSETVYAECFIAEPLEQDTELLYALGLVVSRLSLDKRRHH